jgi:acyl carrier protein
MNKIELFNGIIGVITPVNSMGAVATSLDQSLADTGLDSLDLLMMGIYLSDIYGVPEEIAKTMQATTVNDMFLFMEQQATKTPTSVHDAIASIK